MDLMLLKDTSNQELINTVRPKKLTLEEFNALPVSTEEQSIRKQIYALEEYINAMPDSMNTEEMEQAGIRPIHRFVNGLYHRELFIPPDKVVMGKRHAIEHIVMLIQGSCWCVTERGKEFMTAPMTFISPAGEKRVVITAPNGDGCTWVTLHPTDKTDLNDIEQEVIIAEPDRQEKYDQVRRANRLKNEMSQNKGITL